MIEALVADPATTYALGVLTGFFGFAVALGGVLFWMELSWRRRNSRD